MLLNTHVTVLSFFIADLESFPQSADMYLNHDLEVLYILVVLIYYLYVIRIKKKIYTRDFYFRSR